jgi:hypothetical protein
MRSYDGSQQAGARSPLLPMTFKEMKRGSRSITVFYNCFLTSGVTVVSLRTK